MPITSFDISCDRERNPHNRTRIQDRTKGPSSFCDIINLVLNMNTRILGPGTRLLRLCLSRRLPIQSIHSSVPRSFSCMCSRLYAGIPIAFVFRAQLIILDNVKRYTEQHEWIEIDGDDIGRSDKYTCFLTIRYCRNY